MNDQCIQCGLCREACPTFRATKNELIGPRGRAKLSDNKKLDHAFYLCTACEACQEACPIKYDLKISEKRKNMIDDQKETAANKEMIANIRKYRNPFGPIKKGTIPKKLYCC